jgi:hypothetical protein
MRSPVSRQSVLSSSLTMLLNAPSGVLPLSCDYLRVNLVENLHGVAGSLGYLCRGNPCGQPGGNTCMTEVIRAPSESGGVLLAR